MTEAPTLSVAHGQGALNTPANFKPYNKKGFFNPNVEMNSSLYQQKRPNNAPTNFIGVSSLRSDNMQPTRTFNPSGIKGVHNIDVPYMRTLPVKPKFQ